MCAAAGASITRTSPARRARARPRTADGHDRTARPAHRPRAPVAPCTRHAPARSGRRRPAFACAIALAIPSVTYVTNGYSRPTGRAAGDWVTAFLISQPDPNFKPKASAGTSGRAVTRRGAGLNQLAHQTGTAARAALPQASVRLGRSVCLGPLPAWLLPCRV